MSAPWFGLDGSGSYSSPLAFVYAFRVPAAGVCKIGQTQDPTLRAAQLRGASPLPVEWVRVLWVADRRAAIAAETEVLDLLIPHFSHGEWVKDGPHVAEMFDQIADAVDVTDAFNATTDTQSDRGTERNALRVLSIIGDMPSAPSDAPAERAAA